MTAGDLVRRRRPSARQLGAVALAGVGSLAVVVIATIIRPLEAATIDPDAAASVLYFERIVGGARLEAFVPTTPKPLLTLVYGLTWAVGHDWRLLVSETLLAFGLAVGLAGWWFARLGRTVGGGRSDGSIASVVASTFVVTGLVASPELILEVSRANSLVWALAGWLVAGLAMTGARRRPLLAGIALLVAGLARFETLAIVGIAGLALATQAALPGAGIGRRPARRDWLVLVGALALPIACLHDLLLTGDPFFWATVPARYTELYLPGAEPLGPLEYARILAARYAPQWALAAVAALGLAFLVVRRAWVAAIGLAGLGGGLVVLLFGLSARGTYISARYYEPLDLALLGLAGAGVAGLVALALGRRWIGSARQRSTTVGLVLGAVGAATVVLIVAWPPALIEPRVARELDLVRTASDNVPAYMRRLGELAGTADGTLASPGPVGAPLADPAGATLFVPSLLRPRIAVETGASLSLLGDSYAAFVGAGPWVGLHPGQHLYHDRAADRPAALDDALQADPARLGVAEAAAEFVDDVRGVRILIVTGPDAPAR